MIIPLYYQIYLYLLAGGFAAGLYRFRQKTLIQPVIILLGITLCTETISKILIESIGRNCIIFHFYHPIQAALWGVFFYRNIQSRIKRTIAPTLAILLVFGVINTFVWQNLEVLPSNFIKFECAVLLFWSFTLFLEFLDRPVDENIFYNSSFIICVSVIWFNLVSFPFFALLNFYIAHNKSDFSLRGIHYFSNYAYYALLLCAMLLSNRRSAYK